MSGNRYPGQLFLSARPMLHRIALRLPDCPDCGSTRNQSRSATRDQSNEFAAAVGPYAKAAKVFQTACALRSYVEVRCVDP